jgi:5-oxoprolinase (ATP-hydrolysing) subunit A
VPVTGSFSGVFPRVPVSSAHRVVNTGSVVEVDLNADLGEDESVSDTDRNLLETITSANVACGFHAGNRAVMRAIATIAAERGVTIGAHVSTRDRAGFGRRGVDVPPRRLTEDIIEQIGALTDEATVAGATVSYVKPHGALYNLMGTDDQVAAAVVDGVRNHPARTLVAQPDSAVVALAVDAGLRVIAEGFPDRSYRADGTLVPRTEEGALVHDPADVARRAVSLAVDGGVAAVDGSWTPMAIRTLCIHGDSPGAIVSAHRVRDALETAGVTLRSFAEAHPATHHSR